MSRVWITTLLLLGLCSSSLQAAPPWAKLVPFRKIEADPNESYELTESHGPWMIMCASFAGATAEQQAHELVLELRRKYKLEAYTFAQHYDFTDAEPGNTLDKYGFRKRMRNLRAVKFDEIAVLVGNFHDVDQPDLADTLQSIKTMHPESLQTEKQKGSSQQLANLRAAVRRFSSDPRARSKGPMGKAFVTKNPLLPDEFFAPKGLDPFVVELNEDLPFSLLNNPGTYTVKVASFRGAETVANKPADFAKFEEILGKPGKGSRSNLAKIDEAAVKASKLTKALREKGIEAYEFHDRTESIVCIGSFDSVGTPRADGKTEINPAIHRLMQEYGPEKVQDPKLKTGQLGLRPRSLEGIPFDVQPLPVVVPKQSVAASLIGSDR